MSTISANILIINNSNNKMDVADGLRNHHRWVLLHRDL